MLTNKQPALKRDSIIMLISAKEQPPVLLNMLSSTSFGVGLFWVWCMKFHVTGLYGLEILFSNLYRLIGRVHTICKSSMGVENFDHFVNSGRIAYHHIAAETLDILVGLFHLRICLLHTSQAE
jgi:hypothetical protein